MENTCSVHDPILDLPWLHAKIEEMMQHSSMIKYFYIIELKQQGQTVFIFANCCPFCNSVFLVYDCEGNSIGSLGDDRFDADLASRGKVIWKAENSSCGF